MRPRHLAVLAGLLLAPLSACTADGAKTDRTACKIAMSEQLKDTAAGKYPAACAGIDEKSLQRLAREVVAEQPKSQG